MSDVVIQDQLFADPRLDQYARTVGWDVARALGTLTFLWHASQALEVTEATEEQIAIWARLDRRRGLHRRHVEAMCAARFLVTSPSSMFLIVGNDWRIAANKNRRDKAKKAAKNRWGDHTGHDARSMPEASPKQCLADAWSMQRPETRDQRPEKDNTYVDSHESPARGSDFGPRELAELWNAHKAMEHASVSIRLLKPNSPRWRHAKARLKDNPDPEFWTGVIERVARSKFLRGLVERRNGEAPWKASFDWLVKPDSAAKVLEGQYDDRGGAQAGAQPGGLYATYGISLVKGVSGEP